MRILRPTLEEFCQMASQPGFAFARYGDGTFYCMQGCSGENCDGVQYRSDIGQALIDTLRIPTLTHSIGSLARRAANAEEWLESQGIEIDPWYDCDILNNASYEGRLAPFVNLVRSHEVVQVGPPHLQKLRAFERHFVECHPTKAFDQMEHLYAQVSGFLDRGASMVLLSAGFTSIALLARLHQAYPQAIFLDTGSVWDKYVGVFSRSAARKRGWQKIRALGWKNFEMDILDWRN